MDSTIVTYTRIAPRGLYRESVCETVMSADVLDGLYDDLVQNAPCATCTAPATVIVPGPKLARIPKCDDHRMTKDYSEGDRVEVSPAPGAWIPGTVIASRKSPRGMVYSVFSAKGTFCDVHPDKIRCL